MTAGRYPRRARWLCSRRTTWATPCRQCPTALASDLRRGSATRQRTRARWAQFHVAGATTASDSRVAAPSRPAYPTGDRLAQLLVLRREAASERDTPGDRRSLHEKSKDELVRFFTLTMADVEFVDPGRGRGPTDRWPPTGDGMPLASLGPLVLVLRWRRAPGLGSRPASCPRQRVWVVALTCESAPRTWLVWLICSQIVQFKEHLAGEGHWRCARASSSHATSAGDRSAASAAG